MANSKLIISCVTEDELFDSVEVPCKHLITKEQWAMIKKALPLVFAQAEENFMGAGVASTKEKATASADFEVVRGECTMDTDKAA